MNKTPGTHTSTQANLIMLFSAAALVAHLSVSAAPLAEQTKAPVQLSSLTTKQSPELPQSSPEVSLQAKEAGMREFPFNRNTTPDVTLKTDMEEFGSLLRNSKITSQEAREFVEIFSQFAADKNLAADSNTIFLRSNRDLFCIDENAGGRSGKETTNTNK